MFYLIASVLAAASVAALPTTTSQANVIISDTLPTATGPTCIQTRGPDDPPASDINKAVQDDDSIRKACDVTTQETSTINNGLLSVIYYALDSHYFFNTSHSTGIVNQQQASPNLCPDTYKAIFSTCVMNQQFWGGWILKSGTNHSITDYVYPKNPLPLEGETSSTESTATRSTRSQTSDNGPTNSPGTSRNTQDSTPSSTGAQQSGSPTSRGQSSRTSTANTDQGTTSDAIPGSTGTRTHTNNLSDTSTGDADSTVQGQSTTGERSTSSDLSASQQTGSRPSTTNTNSVGRSSTSSDSQPSSIPLPFGGTVVYTTIGTRIYSETFVPTTYLGYTTIVSAFTTSTIDSHSSSVPVVIGPGGVAWVPFGQQSGTLQDLLPPTVLPTNSDAPQQATTSSDQSGSSAAHGSGTQSTRGPSNPTGTPSQTPGPGTTRSGEGTTAVLPLVTTKYDPEPSTVTSVGPEITGNTAIRTSDDHHGLGLYPFWKGGPHCFIICPPGIDNGGIILWGMPEPGIYPPPTDPPIPGIDWPTITVDEDLKPTATQGEEEPTETQPDETGTESSAKSTRESTSHWMQKQHPIGGASGTTSSATTTSGKSNSVTGSGSITEGPSAGSLTRTSSQTTSSVDPEDCPNNPVDENAPNCPRPSSATGFSCGLASNVGAATYTPATWTTLTGSIAPGPNTYCTCGSIIAGINTQTSDGVVYTICAGDPQPTVASSTLPPPETTQPPKPKASEAIIVYREDS
ncbi:MAG: hypothetical protein Q9220_007800, partial [cf. Caloplaca sp. 1 TL-2023]